MTNRLIVSTLIGLTSELFPIFGMILVPIHYGLNPMTYVFLAYAVNFIIVAGMIYGMWGVIATWKERGMNSN